MLEPSSINSNSATSSTSLAEIVRELSPTQKHFFKKQLIKVRLQHELSHLNDADCLEHLGPPFKGGDIDVSSDEYNYPLVGFFLRNFVTPFPLIASNSSEKQKYFWQEIVQPFVKLLNSKLLLSGDERTKLTKRHKVNLKLLKGIALFYNSVLVSENELDYFTSVHLKSTGSTKVNKLGITDGSNEKEFDPFVRGAATTFINGVATNIVAVRRIDNPSGWGSWFSGSETHHFEFVIKVSQRNVDESVIEHFIARRYSDFKRLEDDLSKSLPGVMGTLAPRLPKKLNNDDGTIINLDKTDGRTNNRQMHREKLRLALRGYMLALLQITEVVHSPEYRTFLNRDSFQKLTLEDKNDEKDRIHHEQDMLQTQKEFHQRAYVLILELTKEFESFKEKLITEAGTLEAIFEELGKTNKTEELSPMIKTFLEWGKLEIAATIYQLFLGSDGGGELLAKVKKFHSLFPYGVVYSILRFTNPVKIITRMVDLLFVRIPSFHHGNNNLILMMFIMLLNEDLSGYEKEISALENKLTTPEVTPLVERIRNYVANTHIHDSIREESEENGKEYFLTVLLTEQLDPKVTTMQSDAVKEAFAAYIKLEDRQFSNGNANHAEIEKCDLYVTLRQYWHLLLRKRDKDIMVQLWKEPELTQLMKQFLEIFYQPMMKIVGKCDVHLVFNDFKKFLDDLLDTLEKLSSGEMYLKSLFEIFNILKDLLDKHEIVFWRFIRDLYRNDDLHLFTKIIQWIEKFLNCLRLKFDHTKMVEMNLEKMALNLKVPVDGNLLRQQVDAIATLTTEKRKLYKEYLERKAFKEEKNIIPGSQGDIDNRWKRNNDRLFEGGNTFGLDLEDIDELNTVIDKENKRKINDFTKQSEDDKNLQEKLKYLETAQHIVGTSELDKFDGELQEQLKHILRNLEAQNSQN